LIEEPFALEHEPEPSADQASVEAESDAATINPDETAPEVPTDDAEALAPQQHVRAEFDREEWLSQLQKIPELANLRAAAVVAVSDTSIKAMLSDGSESILGLDDGLSDRRAYISENRRAKAYESPSDFLEPGDVIRVKPSLEGSWQLSQVPAVQGALVALDPNNGAILSLVGGYDFGQSHFNRAVQAQRQPGSNFKPFVYAAALEQGFTAATQVNDAPIVFDDEYLEATWRPENSSGKFYGPTRLREALYNSRNLVSIRVLRSIGIDTALSAIGNYGFNTRDFPRDLSVALGSHAVTPLEVATGYAVLANGGYLVEPYLIDRVITTEGELISQANPARVCEADCQRQLEQDALAAQASAELALLEAQSLSTQPDTHAADEPSLDSQTSADDQAPPKIEAPAAMIAAARVMDERVNYLINSMLRDVITKGTGRKALALKRGDLAGKTGTTNGPTDAWFSGFNSDIIASAWVGFDQNQLLGTREYGGSAALPIWIDFMAQALAGKPERPASPPDGIVTMKIDPETGLSARIDDPDAIFEVFREEFAPAALDADSSQVAESIENLF
jgi:penicillin-binding protein 1A